MANTEYPTCDGYKDFLHCGLVQFTNSMSTKSPYLINGQEKWCHSKPDSVNLIIYITMERQHWRNTI